MVACANPAYKNEDLYALLERLGSHTEPSKIFCAVNKKREVRVVSYVDVISIYLFLTLSDKLFNFLNKYKRTDGSVPCCFRAAPTSCRLCSRNDEFARFICEPNIPER